MQKVVQPLNSISRELRNDHPTLCCCFLVILFCLTVIESSHDVQSKSFRRSHALHWPLINLFTHHSLTFRSVNVIINTLNGVKVQWPVRRIVVVGEFFFLQLNFKPLHDWGKKATSLLQVVGQMGPGFLMTLNNYSPSTVITSTWDWPLKIP